ncbi:23S rRNA (adenine(2503)-C(2))-methyltransferase RlmN [Roseivirga sp. E12]|uniref:23S rRNA (adenine(2503)-C(2))-methyltransferase RlmN n=1 Tax=Roseivirga sp. E12 TaxID=2819237 RepID=UPI001ABCF012|nr:23S rRNA (adenine(2503)-C(2))-methyltransferase RlmN [Roseivirga sp. E12]MBO3699647.1 23S rRNA (adenine(2503)-C(2))-methyltransferase RlmN [Roseivirga sp. E12]
MSTSAPVKRDIRQLSLDDIKDFFVAEGEQAFRAKQVYEWLWKKSAKDFDQMTNISLQTREKLKAHFDIKHVKVDQMQRSNDGTIKNAVKLHDSLVVESVLIPTEKRITACISSQVGCSLDCNFCATARLKRMRNLNADEIYDQVVAIKDQGDLYFERPLTNIVYMGMGEPLLNYKNVLKSIEMITSPEGLGMSPRRITLSTVGIPKMIKQLADDDVKFNLAVSLHSAIDESRSKMMPINEKSNLAELAESLQYWHNKTGRKVTFEYVVWKNINDDERHAKALAKYCGKVASKVNIIEYNPIDDGEYQQAAPESLDMYQRILEAKGIIVNVRRSRGKDIDAACGQLANKS